ncbi:GIY-YIG nuclease family protein [soil metagenome]
MSYTVYILSCSDSTFYTGVTTDMERRLKEHNAGPKGAAYTKARRPVALAYAEEQPDRSAAQKREHVIRKLPRTLKQLLAASYGK